MRYLITFFIFLTTNLAGQVRFKMKDFQGYWLCPNQDSAYFKNDTLTLVSFHTSNFQEKNKFLYKYCEFYNWEIKKKWLLIHETQYCKEPTTEKAWNPSMSYEVAILKVNGLHSIILNNFNTRQSSEVFTVLNLQVNKKRDKTLTIKRIHSSNSLFLLR